jgi:hypothetical protein
MPHAGRRSRLSASVFAGVGALALAACTAQPSGAGTVGGMLPSCYGPGPDMNLTPSRVVEVYQNGNLVKRQTFRSDKDHQHYEFELPPGSYDIKGPGIAPIPVRVKSGGQVTADLPIPQCL